MKYLTPQEIAEALRVSVRTVYNGIKTGHIPARRVGRQYRIPESYLEGPPGRMYTNAHPQGEGYVSPDNGNTLEVLRQAGAEESPPGRWGDCVAWEYDPEARLYWPIGTDLEDPTILQGWAAIEYAERHPERVILCHYNTPLEPAEDDITPEKARELAREDHRLIYLEGRTNGEGLT